jgi:hypothetical protein
MPFTFLLIFFFLLSIFFYFFLLIFFSYLLLFFPSLSPPEAHRGIKGNSNGTLKFEPLFSHMRVFHLDLRLLFFFQLQPNSHMSPYVLFISFFIHIM